MDPRILIVLTIAAGLWFGREAVKNFLLRCVVVGIKARRCSRAGVKMLACVSAGAGRFRTPIGPIVLWPTTPGDNDALAHLAWIFAYCGGDQSPRNAALRAYNGTGYVLMLVGPHQYIWGFREGKPPVITTPGGINYAIPLIGSFELPSASPPTVTKEEQRTRRNTLLRMIIPTASENAMPSESREDN